MNEEERLRIQSENLRKASEARHEEERQQAIANGTVPNQNRNFYWNGNYDNRNVIKTKKDIPNDAYQLFDDDGFYKGTGYY